MINELNLTVVKLQYLEKGLLTKRLPRSCPNRRSLSEQLRLRIVQPNYEFFATL